MWLSLCAAVAAGSLPDLVVIVGTPWPRDAEVIVRDLESFRSHWLKRGMASGDVIISTWTSEQEADAFLDRLSTRMAEKPTGRLALFVSGHGIPVQNPDKSWSPALHLPKGDYAYPWSTVFKKLRVQAWRVLLVPDT